MIRKVTEHIRKVFRKKEYVYDMPPCLITKYKKYMMLAIVVLCLGLVTCILLYSGLDRIKAFAFPVVIGVILFFDGKYFAYKVQTEGYQEYEGICIDHKYENIGTKLVNGDFDISLKKHVNALILETEDKIINVPSTKMNEVVPIGCRMKLYVPQNALERKNNNGVTLFSSVYGYEMIPEPEDFIAEKEEL